MTKLYTTLQEAIESADHKIKEAFAKLKAAESVRREIELALESLRNGELTMAVRSEKLAAEVPF